MVVLRDFDDERDTHMKAKFSLVVDHPRKKSLIIPPKFADRFLKPIPKHSILKTVDGEMWEVTLYKFEGIVHIGYGWCELKAAYGIGMNYILHFKYDFDSTFVVTMFDADSVEITSKVSPDAPAMSVYDPSPDTIVFFGMIPIKCCGRCGSKLPVKPKGLKRKRNTGMLYSIYHDPVYGEYSPYFTTILTGVNVSSPFTMELDKDFAKTQLSKRFCIKYLRIMGKDVWPVLCTYHEGEGLITHGWEKFALDNKLAIAKYVTIERSVKDANTWNVWLGH